jgi:hypothetical protein
MIHDGADGASGEAAGCWAAANGRAMGRPGPSSVAHEGRADLSVFYLLSRRIELRQLGFDVCGLLFGQTNSLSAFDLGRAPGLSIPDHQAALSLPYHEATDRGGVGDIVQLLGCSLRIAHDQPFPRLRLGHDDAVVGGSEAAGGWGSAHNRRRRCAERSQVAALANRPAEINHGKNVAGLL